MIEIFAVIAMAIVALGTIIFYVLLLLWALRNFRGK